jgi:hypothetical protein
MANFPCCEGVACAADKKHLAVADTTGLKHEVIFHWGPNPLMPAVVRLEVPQ